MIRLGNQIKAGLSGIVLACLLVFPMSAIGAQEAIGAAPVVATNTNAAVDPTRNVLDLVLAAVKRIDDLMSAQAKRQDDLNTGERLLSDAKLAANKEVGDLKSQHAIEMSKALVDRIDAEAKLRAESADKLSTAEAKRIDAIRAVDVGAVASANEKSTATATTLANQVAQSAADLRTLVASTAATQSANQQQQFADIGKRISSLETAGATNQGKSTYQDPAITQMAAQIERLITKQADTQGVQQGRTDMAGWIAAGIFGFLTILIGFSAVMVAYVKGSIKNVAPHEATWSSPPWSPPPWSPPPGWTPNQH